MPTTLTPTPLRSGGKWNWIGALSDKAFAALSERCGYVTYEPGTNVYRQGERASALYQVLSGRVLMRTHSASGRELLYVYMDPGDCFGELGLIDGRSCHHDADAGPRTTLLRLGRSEFQELRREHPSLNDALLQLLAKRTRSIYETIEDAFLLDMPHRLARRLRDLFQQQSRQGNDPVLVGSHEELANMIGSSRQSVSTLLKEWEVAGIIELSYGRVTLRSADDLENLIET